MTHQAHDTHDRKMVLVLDGGSHINAQAEQPAEPACSSLLLDEAAADGLTSVQNASWSPANQPVYLRALAAGTLKLRFRFAPLILPTMEELRGTTN